MPNPEDTTLIAVVGTYTLTLFTEIVKFLSGQATEVLKHRRERSKAAEGRSSHALTIATPPLPDIFDGNIGPLTPDFEALEPVVDLVNDLRKDIEDYVQGIRDIDPEDPELLAKCEALRQLLELVYSQRITFKGEQREVSRTLVRGHINVKEVVGYAAAVRARLVTGGTVIGYATAERVPEGGRLVGTDVDTIKPGG